MSAPDLNALLEEWRQLTLHESVAIKGYDWEGVRACQEAKKALQVQIDRLPFNPESNASVRKLTAELATMESENNRRLSGQMQALLAMQQELDGSTRNLQRVRQSYCQANAGNWQSYG